MAMDLTWILSAKDDASPVFDRLKQAGSNAASGIENAFGGLLNKFNLVTGAVGALATVAGGAAFAGIIKSAVDWDISVGRLANTLGMTTAQASVYSVAMQRVGVDQDVAEKAGLRLAKTLDSNESVFKKLGVATRDTNGNLRSTADLMPEVNQKLSELKSGTDRNVMAMEIYGRSWNDVRQLLKITPEAMDAARKKAEELHLIVGDEGVAQTKKYKEGINDLNLIAKSLSIQFGNALLPNLIKVGAWFGSSGPILAQTFDISLKLIGKTIYTLGSTIGIFASQLASLGIIAYKVFTGDFSGAFAELKVGLSANKAYMDDMKKTWTDWSNKPITSKAPTGNQLPSINDAAATKSTEETLKQRLQLWKNNAKEIIKVEEKRIQDVIKLDKDALKDAQSTLDERTNQLKKFKDAYTKVLESISTRDKALADERDAALYKNEDSYSRYYRLREQSETAVNNIVSSSTIDAAKKLQLLDDEITKQKQLRDDVLAGKVENVSSESAEYDFLNQKQQIEQKIKLIGDDQIKTQQAGIDKAQEAVNIAQKALDQQEAHLKQIKALMDAIPNVTEKVLNIKVTGLDAIQSAIKLSGSSTSISGGFTSSVISDSSDSEIPEVATGTNYIKKGGLAIVHEGEAVIPKQYNPAAGGSSGGQSITLQGGISVTVQGGNTSASTAAEIARQIYPEIKKLARMQRA